MRIHDCSFELVLYDIDGTLVDTGGAGMAALQQAAEAYFGAPAPTLDLAGSTDLGIVKHLLDHYGHASEQMDVMAFFDCYHQRLQQNLASDQYQGKVYDGVRESLVYLAQQQTAIGLLTGNTKRGAEIKTCHFGLDSFFPYGAYGDDFADRNRLGPVALARAQAHHGKSFSPQATLVIGDTPKDIACAHAMGAKCLAVATGAFDVDALRAHGADWVLPSLVEWI
ncbi:MAG: HAD family hydrolase [Verrucomicrobia bacterium]|jgi:phosphoglycolate phosphatase|nr:MAG: HAD family hydrolase [Verrucomicrobiota bacterium]